MLVPSVRHTEMRKLAALWPDSRERPRELATVAMWPAPVLRRIIDGWRRRGGKGGRRDGSDSIRDLGGGSLNGSAGSGGSGIRASGIGIRAIRASGLGQLAEQGRLHVCILGGHVHPRTVYRERRDLVERCALACWTAVGA